MNAVINEIRGLDVYIKAMIKHENREPKIQDLNNLLMHVNNLKKFAGIENDVEEKNKYIKSSVNHSLMNRALNQRTMPNNVLIKYDEK